MDTIPCSVCVGDVFFSSPVLVRRQRRFLLFWGAFSGRYFVLSMFECHVKFERIFEKFLNMSVDIVVPEPAVTSLPRLLACRPWQAASGSSGNCITVTAGNHHPHIGEQGRVLVFRQQFRSVFAVFFEKKKTYCLAICTKHERCFSTSSRAKVSAG